MLASPVRLARAGALGLNRRNADYVLARNPRHRVPLVDRKLTLAALCDGLGIPTPAVYAVAETFAHLDRLPAWLDRLDEAVIKPDRGSSGRGVLVLARDGDDFVQPNGVRHSPDGIRRHVAEILSGVFSLGEGADAALIQQRIHPHPMLAELGPGGVPDVRVVVYRGEPAMAMLRLPTRSSGGRANLHQGGVGVGVDLGTGRTTHAVRHDARVLRHPDTRLTLSDYPVPFWGECLELSRRVAGFVGLGLLGVDLVIDRDRGPMVLEANARPGLAVQLANRRGLKPIFDAIDADLDKPAELPFADEVPSQPLTVAAFRETFDF